MICVAFNHTYKTSFYTAGSGGGGGGGRYRKSETTAELNSLLGRSRNWYIIGTGTN